MKASKWLFGIIFSLVILLSACSQNEVPEGTLEPEAILPVRIAGVVPKLIDQNICRRFLLACESNFIPVKADPICMRAICNNPLEVALEDLYRIGLIIPELAQTPSQFAGSIEMSLVDASGKLIARGLASTKVPLLEFSTKLPKGRYNLRVQVISKDVASLIGASPEKYPFGFVVNVAK